MKRKTERGESLIAFLSRAVRDSQLMTNLALNIRTRAARIKPGRLRWYCLAVLFMLWAGETWFCTSLFGPIGRMPHYESIRAMVTEGGAGGKKRGESFQKVFDSLLAIQENRDHWDSLMRERPGLADTLARLLQLDSAFRAK